MTDLRTIERDSIRAFVQSAADEGYLSGRVLDYGCGKQPYRDIVEAAGGDYYGFDRVGYPANVSGEDIGAKNPISQGGWDAVLCTQVVQYASETRMFLRTLQIALRRGYLVLTYPTNWPEVEPEDLHRFTKAGMERLLTEAGFEIVRHEPRARFTGEWLFTGYGCVARA